MRKSLFILFIFIAFANKTIAQQDSRFSHYMYNGLFNNPAYAGLGTDLERYTEFYGLVRIQWVGFPGAPRTQVFGAHTPIDLIHGGVGVHLVNDKLGPLSQFTANLAYSFHLKLGNGTLGIGPQISLYYMGLDGRALDPADPGDAALPLGRTSETKPDVSAGIWYRTGKWYAGVSGLHLTGSKFTFDTKTDPTKPGIPANAHLTIHSYTTAGYNWDITREIALVPSFIFKYGTINQFEVSAMASYTKKIYFGLSYNDGESVIGLIGFSFLKNNALRLGYSYDFITNELSQYSSGSHEIMLSYRIPKKITLPPSKIIIRTPRFRID